ncbi:hypothetical protein [Moraxella lacunata]
MLHHASSMMALVATNLDDLNKKQAIGLLFILRSQKITSHNRPNLV